MTIESNFIPVFTVVNPGEFNATFLIFDQDLMRFLTYERKINQFLPLVLATSDGPLYLGKGSCQLIGSAGDLVSLACYQYLKHFEVVFFRLGQGEIDQLPDRIVIPYDKSPLQGVDDVIHSIAPYRGYSVFVSTNKGVFLLGTKLGTKDNFIIINENEHVSMGHPKVTTRLLDDGTSAEVVIASIVGINTTTFSDGATEESLKWKWEWFPCDSGFLNPLIVDSDMDQQTGKMMIANIGGIQIRYPDGLYWRLDGLNQGVPFFNITSISATKWSRPATNPNLTDFELSGGKTSFFLGSENGLSFYDSDLEEWFVLQGDRWTTGTNISKLYRIDSVNHMVLTNEGLTHVYRRNVTYNDKASLVQSVYDSGRHGRRDLGPEHALHGLISSIGLDGYGNLVNFTQPPSDNEGLWTAMFAAAQCFRSVVTGNSSAAEIATRNYNGMELLQNVTGSRGLLARTVALTNPDPTRWLKFNHSSSIPCPDCEKLFWKDGISQDSIIGHLFFLPIYAELVLKDDLVQQRFTVQKFLDIVDRIVENGYKMVDWDGKRTKWGFWDPVSLNTDLDRGWK